MNMINQETNISFEESNFKTKYNDSNLKTSFSDKIISFLINKKIVKNEQQAQILLLVFIILCLVISFFLFRSSTQITPAVIDPALLR